ncbi:MAG: hypothetical protein H7836_04795 [Magnetococcus sp. YQC-3]
MIKTVTYHDRFSIHDFIGKNPGLIQEKRKKSPFVGLVRLIKDGEVVSKNESKNGDGLLTNMTIAVGREFANQRIFNLSSVNGNYTNYKVDAFGVGGGGSQLDNYNVTLTGPLLKDRGLYNPIPINSNCLTGISDAGISYEDIIKPITSTGPGGETGSISLELGDSVTYNGCNPIPYSVTKCRAIIDGGEPGWKSIAEWDPLDPTPTNTNNKLSAGLSVKIDEACLYATDELGANPIPFAHITFAPKWVEFESTFVIEWFIIF